MRRTTPAKEKECYFCVNNLDEIDYKETELLQRFISSYMKILPKRRTGTCAWHQRKLAQSIKRARIVALLPFVRQ